MRRPPCCRKNFLQFNRHVQYDHVVDVGLEILYVGQKPVSWRISPIFNVSSSRACMTTLLPCRNPMTVRPYSKRIRGLEASVWISASKLVSLVVPLVNQNDDHHFTVRSC